MGRMGSRPPRRRAPHSGAARGRTRPAAGPGSTASIRSTRRRPRRSRRRSATAGTSATNACHRRHRPSGRLGHGTVRVRERGTAWAHRRRPAASCSWYTRRRGYANTASTIASGQPKRVGAKRIARTTRMATIATQRAGWMANGEMFRKPKAVRSHSRRSQAWVAVGSRTSWTTTVATTPAAQGAPGTASHVGRSSRRPPAAGTTSGWPATATLSRRADRQQQQGD